MKVSICIPQYNRIDYLLKSLRIIEQQTYADIEVVISDDCSTDNTEKAIKELRSDYNFPILYNLNETNLGYDRNYRKCVENATGDYCLVLGNDDSLLSNDAIEKLVKFLENNNYPDIGFCNYAEESNQSEIVRRASFSQVLGNGPLLALKYYSCFSFVAGIIYKRTVFVRYNSDRFDRSIYSQIALGCFIICSGSTLFSISEPLVLKDVQIPGLSVNSYKDKIAKRWKDFRLVDGGLKSVINVLFRVFKETSNLNQKVAYSVFRKIYSNTLPFWILDYKYNNALPEAAGIFLGMKPWTLNEFGYMSLLAKIKIISRYYFFSVFALLTPSVLFYQFKNRIYAFIKK